MKPNNIRKDTTEFIGTFALVFVVQAIIINQETGGTISMFVLQSLLD